MADYREILRKLQPGDSLYVMNRTGARTTGEVGNIVFGVRLPNSDRETTVKVPFTLHAPIDLSLDVPATQLKDLPIMRRLLDMGVLEVIEASVAEKILSEQKAQDELRDIRSNARRSGDPAAMARNHSFSDKDIEEADKRNDTVAWDSINRVKNGMMNEDQCVAALNSFATANLITLDEIGLMLSTKLPDKIRDTLMDIRVNMNANKATAVA